MTPVQAQIVMHLRTEPVPVKLLRHMIQVPIAQLDYALVGLMASRIINRFCDSYYLIQLTPNQVVDEAIERARAVSRETTRARFAALHPTNIRICSACRDPKPITDFYVKSYYCKPCSRIKSRERKRRARRQKEKST